jgi:radical SAM superfamily enzyme YgiQ (UPF0313 family)
MKRLRIALGDLRHQTTGRYFVFMPLGISYIASYTLAQLGKDKVEVRLYDSAETILKDIDTWKPDILGLSNYCWNSELSRLVFEYAKKVNPEIINIAGGPEFPLDRSESRKFLLSRPEIDFYVYLEGEAAFANLARSIIKEKDLSRLRRKAHEGVMSIHQGSKKLLCGEPGEKLTDLDVIPSPYLDGLMDQWFNGLYAPSIETTRGCPFSCGFCYAGQTWYSRLSTFSVQRIKDELDYIAGKMKDYPDILLSICDANFGMYERDEDIAGHCKKLQDKYGWPNAFDVTTGKMNYERILKIATTLNNRMHVTCSVQSLNPRTLKVIKRKNLPLDQYKQIQGQIKSRNMLSTAELITPMPEETKDSFLKGIKTVINAGVELVVPYTTMLLKGTYLASPECRKKHKMRSKFRILPRQFGEYTGKKCFEIEEVCISTKTMTFSDYLELRGFALVSAFFSGEQFDVVRRHIAELRIDNFDYYKYLWRLIKSDRTELSDVYVRYIDETKNELWDSKKEIYDFFTKEENYNKLLAGQTGDNLIRKYKTELLLKKNSAAIDLAYAVLMKMAKKTDKDTMEALNSAKKWITVMRDLSLVFEAETYKDMDKTLSFAYDIRAWYDSPPRPLSEFKKKTTYRFFYDNKKIGTIIDQSKSLYGDDLAFRVAKIFINWSFKDFWCRCEPSGERFVDSKADNPAISVKK